jgi:hypothetical protein
MLGELRFGEGKAAIGARQGFLVATKEMRFPVLSGKDKHAVIAWDPVEQALVAMRRQLVLRACPRTVAKFTSHRQLTNFAVSRRRGMEAGGVAERGAATGTLGFLGNRLGEAAFAKEMPAFGLDKPLD